MTTRRTRRRRPSLDSDASPSDLEDEQGDPTEPQPVVTPEAASRYIASARGGDTVRWNRADEAGAPVQPRPETATAGEPSPSGPTTPARPTPPDPADRVRRTRPLNPKERIADRYEIESVRGGSTTRVYVAVDTTNGARVAVKERIEPLDPSLSHELQQRFSSIALRHRCVLPVRAIAVDPRRGLVVVTELAERGGLDRADPIRREELPPAKKLLPLFADFAEGLHHLHGQQVVHGWIKPSDLLISPSGGGWIDPVSSVIRQTLGVDERPARDLPPELKAGRSASPETDIHDLGSCMSWALADQPKRSRAYKQLAQAMEDCLASAPNHRPPAAAVVTALRAPPSTPNPALVIAGGVAFGLAALLIHLLVSEPTPEMIPIAPVAAQQSPPRAELIEQARQLAKTQPLEAYALYQEANEVETLDAGERGELEALERLPLLDEQYGKAVEVLVEGLRSPAVDPDQICRNLRWVAALEPARLVARRWFEKLGPGACESSLETVR